MDAFARTSRSSHADRITAAKASAALVVFLFSFVCGLLPLKLADRWPLSAEHTARISRKPTVASLMSCIGAGVLLFTALVHLQPDVRQSVRGLQAAGRLPDTDHFGDLMFCIGFFSAFAVYETMNRSARGRDRRTDVAVQPPAESFHCSLFVAVMALSSHDTFLGFSAGMRPPGPGGVWRTFAALAANKLIVAYCLGQELAWSGARKSAVVACSALYAVVTPVGVAAGMALSQCCGPAATDRSPDMLEVATQGLAAGSLAFVVFFDVLPRQKLSGMTHMLSTAVGFSVMQLLHIASSNSHCIQYTMEKVETFKQQPLPAQPPLHQQPPSRPQQEQQLTMLLVDNCAITPNEQIKHDGDKSINEKTDEKLPARHKISKKEQRKRLNAQMRRFVCPKSPLMVFSELFKEIPIQIQQHSFNNVISFTATFTIYGQMYFGKGNSKAQAKQKACENFLRLMLEIQLHEQSVKQEESPMNVEMEVGENGSVSKLKGLPQEDFPWSHFASLAMYKFIYQCNVHSVDIRTNYIQEEPSVIKPQLKTDTMRKFPENPKNYNPTQLMYLMYPDVHFIETIIHAKSPVLFQVNCVIDDIPFIGQGLTKKEARKECCIVAIKYFWQFDFRAIENN